MIVLIAGFLNSYARTHRDIHHDLRAGELPVEVIVAPPLIAAFGGLHAELCTKGECRDGVPQRFGEMVAPWIHQSNCLQRTDDKVYLGCARTHTHTHNLCKGTVLVEHFDNIVGRR